MDNKSRIKYAVKLSLFCIVAVLLVLGGTFAYWTWVSTEDKDVVFSTNGIEGYIVYDEGESHFVGDFQPYDTFCESVSTTVSVYKLKEAQSLDLRATIFMDVNAIGSNIASSNDVHWVLTDGDSTVTCSEGLTSGNVIASGTFNGVEAGETLTLKSNLEVTLEEKKYTVWIWLDSNGENLSALSGETVDTNVWTRIDMTDGSGSVNLSGDVNPPVIDTNGMIPVVLSNDGTVTTILSTDTSWYDYTEQKWANAVLVSSSSRANYLNTTGKTVTKSDILGYYVWIPRFKYKLWTKTLSATGNEQTIDIIFESANTTKSLGSRVGEYRTHPAFTFGNEELDGFWVGKFETTGSATEPTVLPNVKSLRSQNVKPQFDTALKFAGGTQNGSSVYFDGNNTYGLTNSFNSHMMKNSEWGAVAYLTHSLYGINKEVRLNNSDDEYEDGYNFKTGCGAASANAEVSNVCSNAFGTVASYPQSTTGNITGVFDMAGGANEYVMGNYNNTVGGSGFSVLPISKYYDLYTTTEPLNACNDGICYGHAFSETKNWYSDEFTIPYSDHPWFTRGGARYLTTGAGTFALVRDDGASDGSYGFRTVLFKTNNNAYYIVSYNMNGGTGTITNQVKVVDASLTLSSTVPTRTGYEFTGWNTAQNGSGTSYQPGGKYNTNATATLYAQWRDNVTPNVTFISTNNVATYQTVTVTMTDSLGVVGYYFGKENPENNANITWESVTSSTSLEKTADVDSNGTWYFAAKDAAGNIGVVSKVFYKTTLNISNATVSPSNVITMSGNKFTIPTPTASANYTFNGWYTSSSFSGNAITEYTPSGNTTIYGKTTQNVLSGSVEITGENTYGSTLTANVDDVTSNLTNNCSGCTYTYKWYSNSSNSNSGGTAISGATSKNYVIGKNLTGNYIYVVVTISKSNHDSATITSNPTDAIAPKTVTPSATVSNKTYDATTTATCTISLTGMVSGDTLSATAKTGTFDNKNVGTGKTVTCSGITLSGTDKGNYSLSTTSATTTADIYTKLLTIRATAQTINYGGSISQAVSNVTVETLVSGDSLTSIKLTPSTSNITTNGTITPSDAVIKDNSGAGSEVTSNYDIAYRNGTLTINKADAKCPTTFNAYSGTYDGESHTITATGHSGGTLQYRTSTTETWSTTKPTRTAAGTTTVYVQVAGDSNHNTVGCGNKTIKVTQKSLSLGTHSATYNGTTSYSRTFNTGVKSENVSLTYKPYAKTAADYTYATSAGSGKYIVTIANGTGTASNYSISEGGTFTINKKELAITAYSVTYNGSKTFTRNSYSTGVNSETINLTYTAYAADVGTYTYATSVGSGKFTLALSDSTNYSVSSAGNLTIGKATATIPTAANYCNTLTYNGSSQTLTKAAGTGYSFSGNTGTDAGSYTVTATLNGNYKWSDDATGTKTFSCSIGKYSLSLGTHSATYNGTKAYTRTLSTGIGSETLSLTYAPYAKTAAGYTYATSAGSGKYTVTMANGTGKTSNYAVGSGGTFTINKKELAITAHSVTYNGSKTFTRNSYSTGVNNETINLTYTAYAADVGTYTYATSAGSGKFTLVLSDSTNYSVSSAGNLTIGKATATIPTAANYCNTLTYNGSSQTLTKAAGTGYSFSENTGTDAGSYTVIATLNGNYQWSDNKTGIKSFICSIEKYSLSLGTHSATYNGTTSYSRTFSTGIGSETLDLRYLPYAKTTAGYTYATSAGSGKYTVTMANGTGKINNYSIGSGGTFTINKKELAITAYSTDWVSGATTYVRSSYSTGVNNETINLTYTPHANTPGTYTYATSAGSGKFTLALSDSTNYSVSSAGNLTITDPVAPVATVDVTNAKQLKATSQSVTLACTDNIGVVGYYFGTSTNPAASDYTSITSTTSMTQTATVSSAGTYYLKCKDAAGNVSTSTSAKFVSYIVQNRFQTTTAPGNVFNTTNFDLISSYSYLILNNTTVSRTNSGTKPEGADGFQASIHDDVSELPSTGSVTTTGSPKITDTVDSSTDTGDVLVLWWLRDTYTVSYDACGGTGAPASQTKKWGVALKLSSTKPTMTDYTFSGWATDSCDGSVVYNAGDTYSTNADLSLYAIWNANATISYATSSVTKTYGDAAFTNPLTNSGDGTVTYSSSNTTVATVNASTGAVTIKQAGSATITATVTDGTNYTYATKTATYTLTVNKATNSVSVTCASLTYTGSAQTLISSASTSAGSLYYKVGTALTSSNYSSTGSTTKPTGTNAGSYVVYYYVPASTNYKEASGSKTCSIAKATGSCTVKITGTNTYNETLTATITTSSDGTKGYNWYYNSSNAASGGTTLNTTTQTYKIGSGLSGKYIYVSASVDEGTNYTSTTCTDITDASTNSSATVSNSLLSGSVKITGTNTYNQTLTADVTNTNSATLTYQWWYATSASATSGTAISGATSSTYKIGSGYVGKYIGVTVTATKDNYSTSTWTDITDVTNNSTAMVKCATISPTVSMSEYTYGGTKSSPSISGNSGNGTVTYYYNTSNSNSGGTAWTSVTSSTSLTPKTYYMYATVAATTNYCSATTSAVSFKVKQASGSISYGTTSVTKTYGDAAFTNTLTKTGDGTVTYSSSNTTVATVNASTGAVTIKQAGSATITATVTDGTNYTYATKTATYTLTVNKATNDVTVTCASLTYTGSAQTLISSASISAGSLYYKVGTTLTSSNYSSTGSTTKPTGTNAGSYVVYYYVPASTNYKEASGSKTCTIAQKAASISYGTTSVTKTYGDAVFTNALTNSGDGAVEYSSNNTTVATVNASTGAVTIKQVGSATITATVADSTNYTYATKTATYTLTVGKKGLAISAYSVDWVNGATTYARSSYSTGVGTETINLTYTPYANSVGSYTYATSAGSGKFTLSLSNTTNYSISSAGNLTILDSVAPVANAIGVTNAKNLKATSQSVTLTCTDDIGVTKYYFGTSTSPAVDDDNWKDVTSTTSMSVTETVSAAGTYYLICKDAQRNESSEDPGAKFVSYVVQNRFQTATGAGNAYNTTNFDLISSYTYLILNNTTVSRSGSGTPPEGADGYQASIHDDVSGLPSTGSATTTGSPKITDTVDSSTDTGDVLVLWWLRKTYTVSYDACGGTGAPTSQTKKWGVALTVSTTEPTMSGYNFVGWATEASGGCGGGAIYPSEYTEYTDNSDATLYAIWEIEANVNVNFDPNGGNLTQLYTTPGEYQYVVPYSGLYQLEVWGAQGGKANTVTGGYGGYSVGTVTLNTDDILYVNIGGKGNSGTSMSSSKVAGGYNGGGDGFGHSDKYVSGGGGATHVAVEGGTLSTLSNKLSSILIVAGGGGGGAYESSTYYGAGGHGGGYVGNDGIRLAGNKDIATGGTQTSGGTGNSTGSFGQGASLTANGGPGGGGGFYGGGSGVYYNGGGGGSGYIGNDLLNNKAMYCYNCNTSSEVDTLTYSVTYVSRNPVTNYAKSGDGAAKITMVRTSKTVIFGEEYGNLPIPSRTGYTFVGWNTQQDGNGTYITGDSLLDISEEHTLYAIWEVSTLTLFDNGTDNTDVTGGWTKIGWNYYDEFDASSGGASIGSTLNFSLSNYDSGFAALGTVNKIDLTNYDTLHVTANSVVGGGGIWISSTRVYGTYVKRWYHEPYDYDYSGTITIDVSSLTGSYYIVPAITGSSSHKYPAMSISKIWLT